MGLLLLLLCVVCCVLHLMASIDTNWLRQLVAKWALQNFTYETPPLVETVHVSDGAVESRKRLYMIQI